MNRIEIDPTANGFLITVITEKEGEQPKSVQMVAESMQKCLSQVKNALHKIRP